jgi:hypothetical protein
MIPAQHGQRQEGSSICQPNAFLAAHRGCFSDGLLRMDAKEMNADLQQREALVKERLARRRTEEIKESGLRADVHCQFRVRVYTGLHAARVSGRIVASATAVFVCGHIQAYRGVEIQEYTVEDAIPPKADRPMSTCGMRWPVTLTDAPASVMLGPAETVTAEYHREQVIGAAGERTARRNAPLTPCLKEPPVEPNLRGESGRDLAEVIRDSDGRVDVGKSKVHRPFPVSTNSGPISRILFFRFSEQHLATDEAREPTTYPGKLRPGMPIWKSGMAPELTEPVRLAEMLNCASMLPSSPARISQPRQMLAPLCRTRT